MLFWYLDLPTHCGWFTSIFAIWVAAVRLEENLILLAFSKIFKDVVGKINIIL